MLARQELLVQFQHTVGYCSSRKDYILPSSSESQSNKFYSQVNITLKRQKQINKILRKK